MSWLSTKVTARWGHQPISPGGLPSASLRRQSSFLATASCSTALVAKSNAAVDAFARSSQSHMLWRIGFWSNASRPSGSQLASGQNSATFIAPAPTVLSTYSFTKAAPYPLA